MLIKAVIHHAPTCARLRCPGGNQRDKVSSRWDARPRLVLMASSTIGSGEGPERVSGTPRSEVPVLNTLFWTLQCGRGQDKAIWRPEEAPRGAGQRLEGQVSGPEGTVNVPALTVLFPLGSLCVHPPGELGEYPLMSHACPARPSKLLLLPGAKLRPHRRPPRRSRGHLWSGVDIGSATTSCGLNLRHRHGYTRIIRQTSPTPSPQHTCSILPDVAFLGPRSRATSRSNCSIIMANSERESAASQRPLDEVSRMKACCAWTSMNWAEKAVSA